jgi:hypothetical protein
MLYTICYCRFLPWVRARFFALEVVFTVIFQTCSSAITDIYVDDLLLWSRGEVLWGHLCLHLSLTEAIRGAIRGG